MFQQRAEHLAYMIPSSSHVYMAQIQRAASSTLPVSHTDLTRIPRFLPRFPTRITRRLPSFPARIQRCGRVDDLNQRGEDQRRRCRGLWKTPLQLHAQLQRAALSPQWKPFGASRTRNAGGLPTPETAPPPGEVASPPGEVAPPTAEAASPKAEAASPKAEAASLAAEEAAHANRPHLCRMRPIRRNLRLCECFT